MKIEKNTNLKNFPISLYKQFCNVILVDVWEDVAGKIKNKKKDGYKYTLNDFNIFKNSNSPPEQLMESWKMDNPTFEDLLVVLQDISPRAINFIENKVIGTEVKNIFIKDTSQYIHQNYSGTKFEVEKNLFKYNKLSISHISFDTLNKWTKNFNKIPKDQGGHFISSGGFSDVFLGIFDNKKVAVKKLKGRLDVLKKQFINEIQIFTKCSHDNLLKLLYYSKDGPQLCLVYEYIPSGSLHDHLISQELKKNLTAKSRIIICLDTLKALEYLHEKNLVHRDVKSSNILLNNDMQAKLADFGIVRLISKEGEAESNDKKVSHVITQTIVGTLVYMAPEYLFDQEVSPALDLYSFGIVLMELLLGMSACDTKREVRNIISFYEDHFKPDPVWLEIINLKSTPSLFYCSSVSPSSSLPPPFFSETFSTFMSDSQNSFSNITPDFPSSSSSFSPFSQISSIKELVSKCLIKSRSKRITASQAFLHFINIFNAYHFIN